MNGFKIWAASCFLLCLVLLLRHVFRLLKLGNPEDLSKPAGNVREAVVYSLTGAMNPKKKESAFLHLPTYFLGIFYHIGTFISLILFVLILPGFKPESFIEPYPAIFLFGTAACGIAMFIKRLSNRELRHLSNSDDYISNFLVSVFQLLTALYLLNSGYLNWYYVAAGLLWLYIPLGKLKHVLYFFAARYFLGRFYGWRAVWPVKTYEE